MSRQIELDRASKKHLDKQFNLLKANTNRAIPEILAKIGEKLKTTAQLRIKGRGHIVTSRLVNSIYVKGKGSKDPTTYSDTKGHSYSADLSTVMLLEDEVAIGTNVEYADKIELKDSYLYWAMRNIDVQESLAKEMKDFLRFGGKLV